MRVLTYILLPFIILTSCSNKQISNVDDEANQSSAIKETFVPVLNGVWVLAEFIKSIEATKSPLKSADKLDGIVTMIIESTNPLDSFEVGVSWNNHEGSSFITYSIAGQYTNSLKTNLEDYENESNFYELGQESISNQVHLVLYHYSNENKLIDKRLFTKVAENQEDNGAAWGLQYIVNEKLFSGNYLLIDTFNNKTNVSFKSDGTLIGIPDFKTYHVITDFMGGPETILDGIVFNVNESNSFWFAFEIQRDTTYLYSTIGDEEAGELLQLDKIIYKLVRQ